MIERLACCTVVAVFLCPVTLADGTVSLILDSSVDGKTVSPGAPVDWAVRVSVSSGDNYGLALLACDLVQDPMNPALLDIPPGDPATIPAEMAGFDRPGGITNPGENGASSGYIGVQRGEPGQMNLIQIGGAQNTFGQPGSEFGTDAEVDAGIGQGAPQLVVAGGFAAPATEGCYTFSLQTAVANVLESVGTPPDFSQVSSAAVNLDEASITFVVAVVLKGDINCDGEVNFGDINPFVLALSDPDAYAQAYPNCPFENRDINEDGEFDFDDINPFVTLLSQ